MVTCMADAANPKGTGEAASNRRHHPSAAHVYERPTRDPAVSRLSGRRTRSPEPSDATQGSGADRVTQGQAPRPDTAPVSLPQSLRDELKPLVFSVMPYGDRVNPETGLRFNFDRIHSEIVVPSALAAGCQVIRSDHEALGGVVHTSMFERLLLADVVIADISLPNPNVFYELGVRHATRPRATITMGCFTQSTIPFDIAPLRHLTYNLTDSVPTDAAQLRTALTTRIQAGLAERAATDSPLFSLVGGYPAIELSHDAAESYRDRVNSVLTWRALLAQAVDAADTDAVDRLVADCSHNPELRMDAVLAYRDLGAYSEMIGLLEHSDPSTMHPSEIELAAFARNRRNLKGDRAYALRLLEALVHRDGMSSERGALMGRIYKDSWLDARERGGPEAESLLLSAIDAYRSGLEADPRDPYPGVNLTTLLAVAGMEQELTAVAPVVAFALARRGGSQARDYFDLAALCELSCATGDDATARRAAMGARGRPHPTWARHSTVRNLTLLGEARPLAHDLARHFA